MNRYIDTRGNSHDSPSFCEVIVEGIAPGRGLYVPQTIPALSLDEICALSQSDYTQCAASIYQAFDTGIDKATIDSLMQRAYAAQWDDPRIAPVVSLDGTTHLIELFHGPTLAFKDLALQCLPRFFEYAVEKLRAEGKLERDHLILVATSGDTGKAALEGFAGRKHVGVCVFYPHSAVSDIQRLQMVTQKGDNVAVFAVRGDFDDCQTSVKLAFGDAWFRDVLSQHNLAVTSANSINWGRLMPQIIYYLSAYADLVARGCIQKGEPIDVCVPTGNFGNILAAYYARRMGTPIERLLCASNENNILTDFINTGVYDMRGRDISLTVAPSMDILISSNVERQLFELCGRDPERISAWMNSLFSDGHFEIDAATLESLQELYCADYVDNTTCLKTIRSVFRECGYLCDPHTAVGLVVAHRHRSSRTMLVASTAHWAKFAPNVCRGLYGVQPGMPLPGAYSKMSGIELIHSIARETNSTVPACVDILEKLPARFNTVIDAGEHSFREHAVNWIQGWQR